VAFARQLSDDRFKAFLSLIAPADECGSLGRREEGLTRAQEAAGLYRELARARILKIVLAPPPGDVLLADAHHAFPAGQGDLTLAQRLLARGHRGVSRCMLGTRGFESDGSLGLRLLGTGDALREHLDPTFGRGRIGQQRDQSRDHVERSGRWSVVVGVHAATSWSPAAAVSARPSAAT
jgi:hypothetical protein